VQSKTIRDAVDKLKVAMKDYKSLMKDSTTGRINTVIKIGAIIAEVFLPFSGPLNILYNTDGPERKAGIWSCKISV
jgi:hypothetical protein